MAVLTSGAILGIYRNEVTSGADGPLLQVIDIRPIKSGTGTSQQRYRLILSDGDAYQQAMLATQKNDLVTDGKLKQNAIVRLSEFICNEVQNRRIVIVLDLDIVEADHKDKIGAPQNIDTVVASGTAGGAGGVKAESNTTTTATSGSRTTAPQQQQRQAAPVARNNSNVRTTPISALNPYQNRWTIKARVTSRGDKRSWNNARGQGTLFSADLLDEHGGEIRCTFFKEACEKFYDMLEVDAVFTFSGGRIKPANRQYSSIKNDYEVTFDMSSVIERQEDQGNISKMAYNFCPFDRLMQAVGNSTDVCGVIIKAEPLAEITTKAGRQAKKRDLTLVDSTGQSIRCTLWGDKAEMPDEKFDNEPVITLKGCKVSDWGGCSLSTFNSTFMDMDPPDIPEAAALKDWYAANKASSFTSLSTGGGGGGGARTDDKVVSERHTLASIKDLGLGYGEKPDWISVKGSLTFVKHDNPPWYKACPKTNKKCIDQGNGTFFSEAINEEVVPVNRYVMSTTLADHSGSSWATCFNDQGNMLMGQTADEMEQIMNEDPAKYESMYAGVTFGQFMIKLRVKVEQVNDEARVKAVIQDFRPLNAVEEGRSLIDAIATYGL